MSFTLALTNEQAELQEKCHRFARDVIRPVAAEYDQAQELPWPVLEEAAEQGLYDYEMTLWFGLWAPAGTPIPIVQKLNGAINAIVLEPVVKEQYAKLGIEPSPMKTEEFAKFVRSQMDFYKKIVRVANVPQQ